MNMGIQRQVSRHHQAKRGELASRLKGGTRPRTTLEKWNDGPFYEDGFFMHATKGIRYLNIKRDRAQIAVAELRHGRIPIYTIFYLDKIARFLKTGLWI